jgi:hypothetical protein
MVGKVTRQHVLFPAGANIFLSSRKITPALTYSMGPAVLPQNTVIRV